MNCLFTLLIIGIVGYRNTSGGCHLKSVQVSPVTFLYLEKKKKKSVILSIVISVSSNANNRIEKHIFFRGFFFSSWLNQTLMEVDCAALFASYDADQTYSATTPAVSYFFHDYFSTVCQLLPSFSVNDDWHWQIDVKDQLAILLMFNVDVFALIVYWCLRNPTKYPMLGFH